MSDKNARVITRIQLPGVEQALLSIVEPKNFTEANKSVEWVKDVNGKIEEEVYIEQPEGFLLSENKDYICKLKKELYGLNVTPQFWLRLH